MQGPNVRKLIARKMSNDLVKPGFTMADTIDAMLKPDGIVDAARSATAWIEAAILAIRSAADPNPYRKLDDEAVAGLLLERIGEEP